MVQRIKTLAKRKPGNLSLTARTQDKVEGGSRLHKIVLLPPQAFPHTIHFKSETKISLYREQTKMNHCWGVEKKRWLFSTEVSA